MKAIVLEAGASYGAQTDHGVRPPLVNQVLQVAARLGILDPGYAEDWWNEFEEELEEHGTNLRRVEEVLGNPSRGDHVGMLRGFVEQQLFVRSDDYLSTPVDFESVMSLVEGEVLGMHGLLKVQQMSPKKPTPADMLEQQLHLALCGSLVATTDRVVCPYHVALAKWLRPRDLVLSFNYDLLMDRALETRGDWAKNDGYGLDFHRIGKHSGTDGEWRVPLVTNSAVKLLKMHGSLNWLYCRDSWQSLNVDLYTGKPLKTCDVLYCLDDMNGAWRRDHPLYEWWARYEHEDDGYIFDLHSLIVPPTMNKAYRNMERFLGSIWGTALLHLLTRVEELVLIGYSLRPQDARSWWFFRKVAHESDSLRRVSVVDPSDEVFERIKSVFREREVVRAALTLEEFARAL